ncbi:MAG: ABC transporter ATP-binding protein [Rhodocyclaceae bacterium]
MSAAAPVTPAYDDVPALAARGVGVHAGHATLLEDIDLEVRRGELFGLIGPNGAGKSTLVKVLAQLRPYCGNVLLDGQDAAALPPAVRATRLAYLAQNDHAGWPLAVADFVALGRMPHRPAWGLPWRTNRGAAAAEVVDQAIREVGLWDFRHRRLDTLSGGERARARLARALAVEAPLLLADEPVAALDPFHQLSVMELLRRLCARGMAIVVVLHDLTLASRFCDRLLMLHRARAVACGAPRAVLTPRNLQHVYRVEARLGEHQDERYVLPWRCEREAPAGPDLDSGPASDSSPLIQRSPT